MNTNSSTDYLPPRWLMTLAGIGFVIWVFIALNQLLLLLFVGYLLSYLSHPILMLLERKGISRRLGVFVLFFASVFIFILFALTAMPVILREATSLLEQLPTYLQTAQQKTLPLLDKVRGLLSRFGLKASIESSIGNLSAFSGEALKGVYVGATSALLKGYSVTMAIINIALLPFIVYYLSIDFEAFHKRLLAFTPKEHRMTAIRLARQIDKLTGQYFRGQLIIGTILFLLFALSLGLIGIELWLVLAMISGFGQLIPYLGFVVGLVLSTVMALVTFGDWSHVIMVWTAFGVIQMLEGMLITPKVLGETVGLHPLVIILAIVAGGSLFGLLGIVLAVPAVSALRVIGEHFLSEMPEEISEQPLESV